MPREWAFRLRDIIQSAELIVGFVRDLDSERFEQDRKTADAVLRDLAISINYFLGIILVYLTTQTMVDKMARSNPVFILGFLMTICLSGVLLVFSVSKLHRVMFEAKQELLERVHWALQETYCAFKQRLDSGEYDMDLAAAPESQGNIWRLCKRMPVWPFDFRLLSSTSLHSDW